MIGAEVLSVMLLGATGNIFYATDGELQGRNISELPNVRTDLFDFTNPRHTVRYGENSAVSVSPIFGSDNQTPRFFLYTKIAQARARAEKMSIALVFVVGSVITLVLTSFILMILFNKLVLRRISSLTAVLKLVETGDLTARIPDANSADEIGFLQRSTNAMIEARRSSESMITHLNRVLKAVRDVNELIAQETDITRLIESACERLARSGSHGAAWILIANEKLEPTGFYYHDMENNTLRLDDIDDKSTLSAYLREASNQKGVRVTPGAAFVFQHRISTQQWYKNYQAIGARLEYIEKIYGVLGLAVSKEHPLSEEEKALIEELATDLSFALQKREAEEEQIHLEARLRQSQKLESVGTLAGGVAHEINNPINGIMNYAQLIEDKLGPEHEVTEYAKEIGKETERVGNIVKNLLTFARVEKESHSPALIGDIVGSTTSLIQTILKGDHIILEVDVPDDLPKIKCRSQQIQQVLMNLLTNARDALNEKYPQFDENKKVSVTARCFENEGRTWMRITVEDNGPGVPDVILGRIFDPFYTSKSPEKGTGLGLSVSHGIVQEHNGMLSVESEAGEWTRFSMDLPVDDGDDG